VTRTRLAVFVLAAALATEGAVAVFVRTNDVANHYGQGRRLLGADPAAPADAFRYVPYPAGRAAQNALLAWLPYRAFRGMLFVLAVGGAAWSFAAWNRMARPVAPGVPVPAVLAAVVLLGPWVARDLDDCGTQLLLLTMLTAGITLAVRGREWAAAGWLGTAVAYKATPLLVLPFAVLAGRWRSAAGALVVAAAWCAAPAAFLGWGRAVELNRGFLDVTLAGVTAADAGENGFEPPRHKNQGFALAVARAVRTYPPGHPLHLPHTLFVQFFDLPPAAAKLIAAALTAAGLALVAWRFARRRAAAAEWAVLVFLCAVLSPVCWGSHLVLGLPAAFLVLRDALDRRARGERQPVAVKLGLFAVAALTYFAPRELVGQGLSVVALSYKPYTVAALVLMGLALARPRG
jgi:hypothetical protein